MKKILYISNIEVPYRVQFFNEVAKYCDLIVVYERSKSLNRDEKWASSTENNFRTFYLDGYMLGNESSFSLGIVKYLFGEFDEIVFGCYNTPMQMFSILLMRIFHKRYCINIDGETFITDNGIKSKLKKFFLKGAYKYFAAGEKCAKTLSKKIRNIDVYPYYFSSLTDREIEEHLHEKENRENFILVVGQYFDYKGLDIAVKVAEMDSNRFYKFVGMGKRTNQFIEDCNLSRLNNVEVIPFLQKEELEMQYKRAKVVVLPSRQECWGLVINEAASFGVPIVSTWGSGAAVEFLSDQYPQFLARPDDAVSMYECIKLVMNSDTSEYISYLYKNGKRYSIEKSAKIFIEACRM